MNSADEDDYTPLKFAAMRGRFACIEALMEAGADVNHHRKGYDTALETAASYTSGKKCFDLLIKSGADVNIVNDAGYPLITWVAGCARPGYLDSLIRAGADVNARGLATVSNLFLTLSKYKNANIADFFYYWKTR